jgi:hypothetical protein
MDPEVTWILMLIGLLLLIVVGALIIDAHEMCTFDCDVLKAHIATGNSEAIAGMCISNFGETLVCLHQ